MHFLWIYTDAILNSCKSMLIGVLKSLENGTVPPDNEHYNYEFAKEEIEAVCEKLDLTFAGIPMSENDFGFGHAERILFTKKDDSEWTEQEMKELDDEINERLY